MAHKQFKFEKGITFYFRALTVDFGPIIRELEKEIKLTTERMTELMKTKDCKLKSIMESVNMQIANLFKTETP